MLKQRVLTALIGIPLFIGSIFINQWVFAAVVSVITFMAMREFILLVQRINLFPYSPLCFFAAIIYPLFVSAWGANGLMLALAFSFGAVSITFLLTRSGLEHAALTMLALVYLPMMLSYLILVRLYSPRLLLLMVLLVWLIDTYQYFAGKKFGKRQLAPVISPKKTKEGFRIGLLLASIFGGVLFNIQWFFDGSVLNNVNQLNIVWTFVAGFILTIILGVTSLIGDLFESWIKRESKVKDSGTFMPGHGGVLDRFDSMLFVAPACYFLINITAFLIGQ